MLKYFSTKTQFCRPGLTTRSCGLLLGLVHGNKCEKGAVRVTDFAIYQKTNELCVCPTTLKMLQKNVLFADRDSIIC